MRRRTRLYSYDDIAAIVAHLCQEANFYLPQNTRVLLEQSFRKEESELGKMVLGQIVENAKIAAAERVPLCQDCGSVLVFLEIGEQFKISGGSIIDAVSDGVRRGYRDGYLRKSICHPLTRKNTGDNTPAVIHTDIVKGRRLKIIIMPKGGGSENMTKLKMLVPSAGKNGIVDFAVQSVIEADSNPCPPLILGIGIGGGSAERTVFLSKKALLRPGNSAHLDPEIAALEAEILEQVNKTGIGPQGLGGRITAMACFIEWEPCHIASMPVAVNLLCHSARHAEVVL